MVDTNSDPRDIDYPIPSNDDASKAIKKILTIVVDAIKEGLELRQNEKDAAANSESKDSSDSPEIVPEMSEKSKALTLKIKAKRKKKINNLLGMKITATEVNDLRKSTGAGMMDCKKALVKQMEIMKRQLKY